MISELELDFVCGHDEVGGRQGWCHEGSLDRNRLRRATLVRGFPVSWAVDGHVRLLVARRQTGGRSRRPPRGRWRAAAACTPSPRGRSTPVSGSGRLLPKPRSSGRLQARAARSPPAVPRSPPGGDNGLLGGLSGAGGDRATRLQPNVARVATALVQSTDSSVQQPHGDGRSGGPTGESPTEGSGLSRGGTPWGDTGAAKRCAGLMRPSDGDFSGGTDDPGRRTFRSLEAARPRRFGRIGLLSARLVLTS